MSAGDTQPFYAGLYARVVLMLAALVTLSVLAIGGTATVAFERAVEPELLKRTRLIGVIVRTELQRALEMGIPIDAVAGLDEYLAETLAKFEEVERIVVTTVAGDTISTATRSAARPLLVPADFTHVVGARKGAFALPVLSGNDTMGQITIELSPLFVRTRLREVFLDVMVIALVAVLIAMELVLAATMTSVAKPLDRVHRLLSEQRAGRFLHRIEAGGLGSLRRAAERLNDHADDLARRAAAMPAALATAVQRRLDVAIAQGQPLLARRADIGDIRLPLFLFSVAAEVAVAFLPLYAQQATRPAWLSPDLAAAAPLMFYLVAIAALAPFAGALAQRFGPRRLFLFSVPPTALALAMLAFSTHVMEITLWRGVMAVFYALATIACQEYALRAAERGSARPVGTFVAVVYGGVFCGSAIGGVIAGRFGFAAAFLSGATFAVLAGALALATMRGAAGDRVAAPELQAHAGSPRRQLSGRLLVILLALAVPMSAVTAVFVWYLTPLMLSQAGSNPAEIGRVVMLYYLAVVVLGPTVTTLADGRAGPWVLTVAGAVGASLALFSLTLWSGFWAIVAAMAALGVAHTLMRAPLYALVQRQTAGAAGVAALRLFERLGAIAGLAASAMLLQTIGAASAIVGLAIVVLAGVAVFVLLDLVARPRRT